jgi:hypothetical protein
MNRWNNILDIFKKEFSRRLAIYTSHLFVGFLLICVCSILMAFHFKSQRITIQFQHMIGNQLLVLGDSSENIFGEKMVIKKFRYYISNLVLIDANGNRQPWENSYFLIDENDSNSKKIILPPAKWEKWPIKALEFSLGIDSIHNCSGIQTGVLDPMNGMFWTWNTGYIFAKLEGNAPLANTAAHAITYHIGGFRNGQNAIRTIVIPIKIIDQKPVQIKVDINAWFNGKQGLKIAKIPICHSPGKLATQFADNYAQMFSIIQP